MMPTTTGMSHMIPSHVLRVGQTICVDQMQQDTARTMSSSHCEDEDLDVSLETLNQLILELDPTFEPIQVNGSPSCISPPAGTEQPVLNWTSSRLSKAQRCDASGLRPKSPLRVNNTPVLQRHTLIGVKAFNPEVGACTCQQNSAHKS